MGIRPVPARLRREPLYEAVWEIRFQAKQPVLELLTGSLFAELSKRGWGLTGVSHLPASNIPLPMRQVDPNLRYVPVVKLDGSPLSVSLGERVIVMSCLRPYIGWAVFGARIKELATVLEGTGFLERPERFSLKYLDIIEGSGDLDALSVQVSVGARKLRSEPLQVRTELKTGEMLHIVEIGLPAQIALKTGERLQGTAVSTDTICLASADVDEFWRRFDVRLEEVHSANKELFFDLLSDETLKNLEPEFS